MPAVIDFFVRLYVAVFSALEQLTRGWFIGAFARFAFAGILLMYFWNSALTMISSGPLGFLTPSTGAFAQILPQMMQAVSYDQTQIPFFPYHVIVIAGTWAEFVLPAMVVLGLFTRFASLGMIGFIVVMSYVDINGLGADATAIGALFDGNPSAMISDQRLLWCFLLTVLVLNGPGKISLDWVLGKLYARRARYY